MAERRAAPRFPLAVECVLRRGKGAAITATTVDVGPGGMSVTTQRPLATDEVLHFDLPLDDGEVDGDARVLRERAYHVYALRFEALAEPARARLEALGP
ncbi:MAG TPA: PilZ domain-containing protein [Solirubrobacteraceae bacterium]|jgi:hypothetical protein|nr:PilZ domain-containing protein [Solirubrobacteraceae bacterium]